MTAFKDSYRIIVGLPKPDVEPETAQAMREAILRGGRVSALVANAFAANASARGSQDDLYARVAYAALRALQEQYDVNVEWLIKNPRPPYFVEPAGTRHGGTGGGEQGST